jgi:hypothetical protein
LRIKVFYRFNGLHGGKLMKNAYDKLVDVRGHIVKGTYHVGGHPMVKLHLNGKSDDTLTSEIDAILAIMKEKL